MEKIYPYLDIIFLVLIVVFLVVTLYRLLGKNPGLQRSEFLQSSGNLHIKGIKTPPHKDNTKPVVDIPVEGSLNYKLYQVKQIDNEFSSRSFITFCKATFTDIVTHFNNRNLEPIKDVLSKKLYDSYEKYITEHEHVNPVEIERFMLVDIINVEIENKIININVKFITKQKRDNISTEVKEIWNFVKEYDINPKRWYLAKVMNA